MKAGDGAMISLIVCILLVIVIVLLIVKIVLMRKSIGEIASSLDRILDGDTNAVITVSSGDGSIRKLAGSIGAEYEDGVLEIEVKV